MERRANGKRIDARRIEIEVANRRGEPGQESVQEGDRGQQGVRIREANRESQGERGQCRDQKSCPDIEEPGQGENSPGQHQRAPLALPHGE